MFYSALQWAAIRGHVECVDLLLREIPHGISRGISALDNRISNGISALHSAVLYGRIECVKFLLKHIHVDTRDNEGMTPLMGTLNCFHGLWSDKKECIRILIQHNANTKLSNVIKKTALHYAIEVSEGNWPSNRFGKDPEVIKWLTIGTKKIPSLLELAKIKILKSINLDQFTKENIRKLGLPKIMQEYIKFTDLDDFNEEKFLLREVSEILHWHR